jgi:Eco57I restriction-modification methylase
VRRGGPSFETIRSEGALLPPDLLQRIAERDKDLDGLRGEDYGLPPNEPLNEAIVRSYNRMIGAWGSFQEARAKLPEADPGTSITRDRFLLVLLHELGYGRVETEHAIEIEGRSYAVSHAWRNVPIHLLGCNVPLGTRSKGVAGASSQSPHGTLQELLNRSEERLWGIVSNGLELRLLRDNSSLTRQAFVSFDLEQMMEGDVYSDFALLWMLCHASRVEGERPHECWLERWSQEAEKQGTRALEGLRSGVEEAISALGSGFLRPGRNAELKSALRTGDLSAQEYYRELLRLVYRLLFLFVAEDRKLLHHPEASEEAKERYAEWYSSARLRRLAERRRGTKHGDLWQSLGLVMRSLGKDEGEPALGLPALGSFLWSQEAIPHLESASLPNVGLLEAVRSLATVRDAKVLRAVDYKNLGAEELGSVYESLLELHPELDLDAGSFQLITAAGNERKVTGSYYTPTSLISVLLDSALDPVLEEAAAEGEVAILSLNVCDPACGSGHFLVAAGHRIAKRLANVRTGDEEPSPEATRVALRDVVSRCLYGVDVNPMAVELCKVSLWMEALDPGRPLSFLDAHVKCGNSLLGTTVELIDEGIPDEAFKPIEGDDKEVAKKLRRQNKTEREGQLTLDDITGALIDELEAEAATLDATDDDSLAAIRAKERGFYDLSGSETYEHAKFAADAWCAAFVQNKIGKTSRVTTGLVRRVGSGRGGIAPALRDEVRQLADEFGFFHWQIEFPQVLKGDARGFDVVLGNPPWDLIEFKELEFFEIHAPSIAARSTSAIRKRRIAELAVDDPRLFAKYRKRRRLFDGIRHFCASSRRYPLTGVGRINSASVFAELMRSLRNQSGRVGAIVPSSIATDATTKDFFSDLMSTAQLWSLYDFENRTGLFPGVDSRQKFCLLTLSRGQKQHPADFVFFADSTDELMDEDRHISLSESDISLFNPNTKTCPIFRSTKDLDLARRIYGRAQNLIRDSAEDGNPWELIVRRVFNMGDAETAALATQADVEGLVPMVESKLFHQFDHRWATYEGTSVRKCSADEKRNPDLELNPQYWIDQNVLQERLGGFGLEGWYIAWRDICRATDERTVIASAIPQWASDFTVRVSVGLRWELACVFLATLNSFVFDWCARQMVGGTHLSDFVMKQLPVISAAEFEEVAPWDPGLTTAEWTADRVLELNFTSWSLRKFATAVGHRASPFRWDLERRVFIRAELDAAFFLLYGLGREDVDYVMDAFPIVRRKDEQAHGEYLTKRLILEIHDEMADAIATARPYKTRLDPPPADPRVAHPPRTEAA